MNVQEQIKKNITSQPEPKRGVMQALHLLTLQALPKCKSWFLDGKDDKGKTVSKAGPGKPIVAIGGAGFMRSLIATGLIDEYILATHPVALGSGLPIFTDLAIGRI